MNHAARTPILFAAAALAAVTSGAALLGDVNAALAELRSDGTYAHLTTTWFGH